MNELASKVRRFRVFVQRVERDRGHATADETDGRESGDKDFAESDDLHHSAEQTFKTQGSCDDTNRTDHQNVCMEMGSRTVVADKFLTLVGACDGKHRRRKTGRASKKKHSRQVAGNWNKSGATQLWT